MVENSKNLLIKLIFLISVIALVSAFFIEYVLGHQPCNLCILERIPYLLAIIIILLNFIFSKLIFNSLLAHGIRPNRSKDKVRIAQYISMMPAEENNEALKKWRINSWENRIAPEGYAFPGDPRNWEQTRYEKAVLNPLGKKLLGLEKW